MLRDIPNLDLHLVAGALGLGLVAAWFVIVIYVL